MNLINEGHPSNVLYRGECDDFAEAMRLTAAACDWEAGAVAESEVPGAAVDLEAFKANAVKAAALYRTALDEFHKRFAAELRGVGAGEGRYADDFAKFADCLESGDYSTLAI